MNLVKISFDSFLKTRKNILYIVSITITLGFVIFLIYNLYFLNNIYAEKVKNNIVNRVILATKSNITDEDIKKINNIENIQDIYRKLNNFNMKLDDELNIPIKYCNELEIPKLVLGKEFDNNYEFEVILPKKTLDRSNNLISLENYYGQEVKLTLNDFEMNVYVIGIYDDISFNSMYINQNLKNKLLEYNPKLENNSALSIIVDNYKNVNGVIENLNNNYGYSAGLESNVGQSDIKMYNIASILIIIILSLVVIFTFVSIGIIIDGIISDERKDIAILKAIGYKRKHISTIIVYRVLAILTISFILGIILSLVFNCTIGKVIENKLEVNIELDFSVYCLVSLLLIIFIYFIALIATKINERKVKKISTIELLKE